jgi:hypothetical protein
MMFAKFSLFVTKKPWLSFLFSLLSWFTLICGFFFFGTYIDWVSASWWLGLILFLILLAFAAPAFVYQCFYYFSSPNLIVGKAVFGRGFLLLFGIMIGCLFTFFVDVPFYLVDLYSWQANGSFGPLGLCFAIISLTTLSCVAGGMKDTFPVSRDANLSTEVKPQTAISSFAQKVNAFMPWFLCSYFLLIVMPYSFALVPQINAFFTGIYTKVAFRAFTCLYFFVYSFLLMKANKNRIDVSWLVILLLLVCFYLIAWITVPTTYSYYSTTFEHGFTYHWIELGQLYIFISLGTFVLECAVFLCLISFFPIAIRSRKAIIWPFVTVILFALFGCVFSYIKTGSLYLDTLRGLNVEKNAIRSIFHSKNAFGIFLFLGTFCSLFLLWYARKAKWIFGVTTVIFLVTAGVIKCYTALIPGLIIAIILLLSLLFKLRKKHKVIFACSLGSVILATALVFILAYIPAVRDHSKIFASLYTNLESIGTSEVVSRTKLWDYCLSLIRGPFTMIGETDVVANSQLTMIEQMAGDAMYNDFHSAFVSFYSGYGLAGLIVYLSMFAFSLKQIRSIDSNHHDIWLATLILFIGAVLFSMPETYTLFVNMSASVFPINLLLLVYPKFLSDEGQNQVKKEEKKSYAF